jgi:hypothetical protein
MQPAELCPMNVHNSSGYGVNATIVGPHLWQFIETQPVYADEQPSRYGPVIEVGVRNVVYMCQYCREFETIERGRRLSSIMKDLGPDEMPPPMSFPIDE